MTLFFKGLYFGCLSRCPVRKVPILGISRTHCLPRGGIHHTWLALTFEHEGNKMKQIVLAILATVVVSSAALAACPPGTAYNCYTTGNGKQSCGCR